MQAIVYSRYGPPDVLTLAEVDKPVPSDDEVLIRVRAAEATKADCELRSFRFSVNWFWLPLRLATGIRRPRRRILGGYLSGEIAGVGKDVADFQVGEEVLASTGLRMGGYAEFVALPASNTIVAKPTNMDFEAAAAVPLGGLNALHFMRRAEISAGEEVLINGAGGSIGAHGVQIAKSMGAVVTGVDIGFKETFVRRMGADRFVDYTREDFTDGDHTYDVIFDMVPRSSYPGCIRKLNPGGRYLKGNPRFLDMLRSVVTTRFSDKTSIFAFARETREELETLKQMIEAGRVVSIVDQVLPMRAATVAHRLVETEERRGAIVISIEP